MSTTHEVRWNVSATPVAVETGDNGGHMAVDTLHENVRKSVGGGGTTVTAGAIDFGGTYTDGVSSTPYLSATSGGVAIGDGDSTFIYVKNLGFAFDDATTLGAVSTDSITIKIGSEVCAALGAGEGWCIPLAGAVSGSSWTAVRGGSTDLAIEVIAFD
jgi:hypothetical protein